MSSAKASLADHQVLYFSIAAQYDNLGDIAIRQVAMDMAARPAKRLCVFTGAMPYSYVEAFEFPPGAVLVSSAREFAWRLLRDAAHGRADVLLSPGPFPTGRWKADLKSLLVAFLLRVTRARGGRVISLGRALRGTSVSGLFAQRLLVRACNLWTFRDKLSREVLGMDVAVDPDLGFGHRIGTAVDQRPRQLLAISLRADRPVASEVIEGLVRSARAAGLVPIFVTQVQRDDSQHAVLARGLGAEVCLWGDHSHREQMACVTEVYSRSAAVATNRLHAAIFGINHGAHPIAIIEPVQDKLAETLNGLVPLGTLRADGRDVDAATELLLRLSGASALAASTTAAREQLDRTHLQVQSILGPTA